MGWEGGGRGGRERQEGREMSGKAEFSFAALPAAWSASAGFFRTHHEKMQCPLIFHCTSLQLPYSSDPFCLAWGNLCLVYTHHYHTPVP